jgi:hypothetical protein
LTEAILTLKLNFDAKFSYAANKFVSLESSIDQVSLVVNQNVLDIAALQLVEIPAPGVNLTDVLGYIQ